MDKIEPSEYEAQLLALVLKFQRVMEPGKTYVFSTHLVHNGKDISVIKPRLVVK